MSVAMTNLLRRALPVLACTLSLGAAVQAQAFDPETWAQLLIDHPAERSERVDTVLEGWVALLDEEPDHPLAEATLALMSTRVGEITDPRGLLEGLRALDAEWFDPAASRRLLVLRGLLGARLDAASTLREDRFADWIADWQVLGPLEPLADPDGHLADADWLRDPTRVTRADGPAGPVTWRATTRPPVQSAASFDQVLWPSRGWWLASTTFELPAGGAGWLELDLSSTQGGSMPGLWSWSLNGAEPVAQDESRADQPSPRLLPVVFREGVNRLVLRGHSEAGLRFAVRVLDADGWPWEGRESAAPDAPLGAEVDARPPRVRPLTSESWLAAQPHLAPELLGVRGWLEAMVGRGEQGLGWLDQAVAAAPGHTGLAALYARLLQRSWRALPDVWRRNRAQALAERVLADDPLRLGPGLAVAERLLAEDQTEDAIERFRALADAHPQDVQALLGLAGAYADLGMSVFRDAAVDEAAARAPDHPRVLDALATRWRQAGFDERAFALDLQRAEGVGREAGSLRALARRAQGLGDVALAESLHREAALREGGEDFQPVLANVLADLGRLDEAEELIEAMRARSPRWSSAPMQAADLALRRGDTAALLARLQETAALSPGWRVVRDRLAELGVPDPAREFQQRYDVPLDVVRDELVPWSDSVVRVLDCGLVYVFDNGVAETYTHDIYQPRDLQGCDALGTQQLGGDVLLVRVVKAGTGQVLETPRVDDAYVLPELQPGDLVETATRRIDNAPADGLVDLGRWTFANLDMPFVRSRYVVSLPDDLPLVLVESHFDGTHETYTEPGRSVHVFETRDRPRVVPEPGMAPPEWFLPWVHFRAPRDEAVVRASYRLGTQPMLAGSPWVERAVAEATAGVQGQEARARALHALVNATLDQRTWWNAPATHALLGREGHPVWLYAGLLAEAGIDFDVIWSRGMAPDADPEPLPSQPDASRWSNELLVLVRPDDGEPAWCDLSARTVPYGVLVHDAPGAEAVSGMTGEAVRLPVVPAEERAQGMVLELVIRPALDGSAELTADAGLVGGLDHVIKEQLQEVPEAFLGMGVTGVAAQVLPGVTVRQWDFAGLDDQGSLTAHVAGDIGTWLDADGDDLVAPLPFPSLGLSDLFGGQGRRALPFWHRESIVLRMTARLELPEGLQLVDHVQPLELEFEGTRYALRVEPDGDEGRAWTVTRTVVAPPFVLEPGRYDEFREVCARIDEAERSRLRFRRVE